MKVKIAIAAVVALVALAFASAAGATWYSNDWRSPTGNILCHYNPATSAVACGTLNDGFTVSVGAWSGRGHVIYANTVYRYRGGPVLPYGTNWRAGQIRCNSQFAGMTCRSNTTGHGFFINRTDYRVW
jgi:hypothetical protein